MLLHSIVADGLDFDIAENGVTHHSHDGQDSWKWNQFWNHLVMKDEKTFDFIFLSHTKRTANRNRHAGITTSAMTLGQHILPADILWGRSKF